MRRKIEKKFVICEINASQLVALSSLYEEENTCRPQSMC